MSKISNVIDPKAAPVKLAGKVGGLFRKKEVVPPLGVPGIETSFRV